MRGEEIAGDIRETTPSSGRFVSMVALGLVAVIVALAALWFTNVYDDYRGSCKYLGGSEPITEGNVGGAPLAATPEAAIAAFASGPGASATGDPVPLDGWHENQGRWVRDLPDGRFLEIAVAQTDRGWIVTSASSCGRL